jgi:murein DD-endopeptidase
LELDVVWPPIAVPIDGAAHLVYELHLSNTADDSLQLTRLDVLTDVQEGIVATFAAEELRRRLGRVAAAEAIEPGVVPAGSRAVLYIELHQPIGSVPRKLRHRLEYRRGTKQAAPPERVEAGNALVRSEPEIVLSAPLRGGPWAAVHNPAWERGHRRVFYSVDGRARIPGRFAIDWIKLDVNGRTARGDDDIVANSIGYAEDVLAVADGVVAALRDDMAEEARVSTRRKHAPEDASGNYIALDLGSNRYVFYEHLKPGSVRVRRGDRVQRGQVIAALGFTGDSTGPHLHLHVADAASPLGAEGLPFILERFDVLGGYTDTGSELGRRRWSTTAAVVGMRRHERPAPGVVVDFGSGTR